MLHDIPARSRLLPTIPITNPKFVYRRSGETDVQATFARARAAMNAAATQMALRPGEAPAATGGLHQRAMPSSTLGR